MLESKRLAELTQSLVAAKSENDRDEIWESIETPFVEDGESSDSKLVTFLYRLDKSDLENNTTVYLHSNIFGELLSKENQLHPLPQKDILSLSVLLPSDLRFTYQFIKINNTVDMNLKESSDMNTTSNHYELVGEFKRQYLLWKSLFDQQRIEVDRKNPHILVHYKDFDNPIEYYDKESFLELPLAPVQPYIPAKFAMIKEQRDELKLEQRLQEYRIQLKGNLEGRQYWIYLPPGFEKMPEKSYPLLLCLDGSSYLNEIPVPTILEKMIQEQVLPPTIAVFLDYSNEFRGLEYDCNESFTSFLANEFIPSLTINHQLPITNDPKNITIVGSSASGLAAFYAALTKPSVFGNVVALSPSFESKKLADFKKIINSHLEDCKNNIFSINIGSYETVPIDLRFTDEGRTTQSFSSLQSNEDVYNHMLKRGAHISLNKFTGGHSSICWQGVLSDRLKEIYDIRLSECIANHNRLNK